MPNRAVNDQAIWPIVLRKRANDRRNSTVRSEAAPSLDSELERVRRYSAAYSFDSR